jgi:two-component system sensor histidine kinase YesM
MLRSPSIALKLYRNLSIRSKLLLVIYVQILIPLILVGFLSYKNSEMMIKENSTDYSRDIMNMIKLRLDDFFSNLDTISQDLLYENKIYEALKSNSIVQDPVSIFEYENSVNSHLKRVVISRHEIRSICIFSKDGKTYYADDNSKAAGSRSDMPYTELLDKARESKGKSFIYIEADDGKVKNLYLVRQINDTDNFEELGIIVMKVNRDMLDEVYQGLTGELRNIAILSQNNELIACRDYDDFDAFSEILKKNTIGESGYSIDKDKGIFIAYSTLDRTGWKTVAYVTTDQMYKDANSLRNRIILICLLCVLVLSALTTIIAFDFVMPVKKLVKGMKQVQNGEENVSIQIDREDELGFLSKTFNEMSAEIHHLVTCVYREQLTRKEAELKALQSQINPHFLFNTLEAINWLAQLNNVPEISETVSDLSELMEASIGRDDSLITIREEFTYTEKYISLQKRRFGDRIEFIKDIQPDLENIEIPRLLIQPLIENAVYHGIEGIRGKGIIKLSAVKYDDCIRIEVLDNGIGMGSEELRRLNERLSMDNDTYFKKLGESKKRRVGIENVNRRIKLRYGEKFGLRIESEEERFTKAIVIIPCQESDANGGLTCSKF